MRRDPLAAIGFTVKSGWASTVLLTGPVEAPRVLDTRALDLSDPALPESRQPYHAGFGTARESGPELSRLVADVERYGRQSVARLIRQYRAGGHELDGAGIVVGSLAEPERIANAHIRIHALEGQLFRHVVEDSARRSGLRCSVWREKDLHAQAVDILSLSERDLRSKLSDLQRPAVRPWRAEQKSAALAAWIKLAAGAVEGNTA